MTGILSSVPELWAKQPVSLKGMPVSQFLQAKMSIGKAEQKHCEARNYLVAHCREILDIALASPETPDTNKAFLLLSTSPSQVANALMRDELFLMKATEVLCGQATDYSRVNRLSCILNNIFDKAEDGFEDTLGVLTQLLAFVDDPSVFALFCSILEDDSKLTDFQTLLLETHFATFVLNAFISQCPPQKAANLCAIVHHCLNNPRLRKSFICVQVLNTLLRFLGSDDVLVQNQLWQALSAFCCQGVGSHMVNVLRHALAMLREKLPRLNMYHTYACDFVEKMMRFCPEIFTDDDRKVVIEIILSMMKNHGNATNMVASVFRLLRTCVKTKGLRKDVIAAVFPHVILQAQAKERTAVAACSLAFMADVEDSRANNKAVNSVLCADKSYVHFLTTYLKPYMALMALPSYGGPVAKYVKKSSSLGDVSKHVKIDGVKITSCFKRA